MRRLAAELGVAPMAIYTHFRSKEELLSGLLDQVSAELELPRGQADWTEELAGLARSMRRGLLAHPGVVALCVNKQPMGPNILRMFESVFRVLRAAGLDGRSSVRAFYCVFTYVVGHVALEVARTGGGDATDLEQTEVQRQERLFFESLPLSSFPVTVELAPYLAECAGDEYFEYGLSRLLAGIRAQLDERT